MGMVVDGCPFNLWKAQCLPSHAGAAIACCRNSPIDGSPEYGRCYDKICSSSVNQWDYNDPITGSFDGLKVTLQQATHENDRLAAAIERSFGTLDELSSKVSSDMSSGMQATVEADAHRRGLYNFPLSLIHI